MREGPQAGIKDKLSSGLRDQPVLTPQSLENMPGRDRYLAPFSNMDNLDYLFLCISIYVDDGVTLTYTQTKIDQHFHAIYQKISPGSALIM